MIVDLKDRFPNVGDAFINSIPEGDFITSGAVLVRMNDEPTVWLVTNGQRRAFLDREIFDKYGFNMSKVVSCPKLVIELIPEGESFHS